MDFRIGHRFGDVNGGWASLWGLENARDVIFEFDYGLTDNMMVGLMRSKGSGQLKQLVSGLWKFRVLRQGEKSPFSVAFSGLATISTMPKTDIPGKINTFEKFAHRMSYNVQMILASKITERLAIQVAPQFTYRNLIPDFINSPVQDDFGIPSISTAVKFQMNKSLALILDLTVPFSELRDLKDDEGNKSYHYPLGIGLEWETGGGHVFQMNLTNSSGIVETDYIPYTLTNWSDGEYRFGFTIARKFKL